MWQTFLEAYQRASSEPDAMFRRLRRAKVQAISEENCQKIVNALAMLEKSRQHGFFYLPLQRALQEAREKLKSQGLTDDTLQRFKQTLQIGLAGQANLKYYQQLETAEFWSAQFQAVRHDRNAYHQMMLLSRQWLEKNRYALYSTQGLLWVYETVLPVLTSWLDYADEELQLKHANLKPALCKPYQRLLTQLSLTLTFEKQHMRESLYQRLSMGLAFHCLGVEYWVLGFVGQINAIKESCMDEKQNALTPSSVPPLSVTPIIFQETTRAIETEASQDEIARLHTLGLFPTANHGNSPIPMNLAPLISSEKPFYLSLPSGLHFLFWGDKVRYEFSQQATLKALVRQADIFNAFYGWGRTSTAPIASLETRPEWTTFTTFLTQLTEESEKLQTAMQKLSPIFHWITYAILKNYHVWLKTTIQKALKQQIKALREYVDKQKHPITDENKALLWGLFNQLETQSFSSKTPVFLKLARLRLHIVDKVSLPGELPLPRTVDPIFQALHADLYQLIHTYEANTSPPRAIQAQVEQLKTLLHAHEKIKNAIRLKEAVMDYRKDMKIERPALLQQWLDPDSDFIASLDAVIGNKKYRLSSLEDHARVHIKSFLLPIRLQSEREKINLSPQAGIENFIVLGKQSLEKTADDVKNSLASLVPYRTQPDQFTQLILAYLYGFLTGLKEITSLNVFKLKLPLLWNILDALSEVSRGRPIAYNVDRIKNKLRLLEKEADET